MPIQPCHHCGEQAPRYLEATSQGAHVNYYACDVCGHIWTIKKDGSGTVTHVTPPVPPKPRER